MFYTVYKITNWFNGKIYIGIHKTNDLNDGYMGSGKLIKRAIEKYGLQYFTKEYLQIFDNPDDMYEMESSLVNEDFIDRGDTYNLKEGGFGGWDHVNKNEVLRLEKNKKARIESNKTLELLYGPEWKSILAKLGACGRTVDSYKKAVLTRKERYGEDYSSFRGKSHTEETKQKMSRKHKERLQDPTKNSQYGTMWITNGAENKKISKDSDIPEGWYKGRNMP